MASQSGWGGSWLKRAGEGQGGGPGPPRRPQHSPALSCILERIRSLRERTADRSELACSSEDSRTGWGRGPEILVGSGGWNPMAPLGSQEQRESGLAHPTTAWGPPFAPLGQSSSTWRPKCLGPLWGRHACPPSHRASVGSPLPSPGLGRFGLIFERASQQTLICNKTTTCVQEKGFQTPRDPDNTQTHSHT